MKRLNGIFGLVLAGVISFFFTHLFFSARMLYNDATILHIDYPRFTNLSWYLGEFLIPEFNSVFGFSNFLFCGYPVIHIYPIGYFFLVVLVSLFGLSYGMALKVTLFGLMLLAGIIPYALIRKSGGNMIGGLMGTLWIWVGLNSMWLNIVTYGMLPFLLATILSMVFLITIASIDFHKIEDPKYNHYPPLLVILLASIALINYMATIFLGAVIGLYIIYLAIEEQGFSGVVRSTTIFFTKIVLITFALISFWLVPTIFIQFTYVVFNSQSYVFSLDASLSFLGDYLERNYYTIIAVLVSNLYLYRHNKKGLNLPFFLCMLFASLLFVLVIPFFNISLLQGINSSRYFCFFEFTEAILVGLFAEVVIKDIRASIGKNKRKKTSKKQSGQSTKNQAIKICLLVIIFIDLIPMPSALATFRNPLLGHSEDTDGTFFIENMNYTAWEAENLEIIDWLKTNTTKDSRILIEETTNGHGLVSSQGHTLSYLAQITDRYYANGHLEHFWYEEKGKTSFLDNKMFGHDILDLTEEDLEYYFGMYNIEFLLIHSNLPREIFNYYNRTGRLLELVFIGSGYYGYQVINATKSFVTSEALAESPLTIMDFSMDQSQTTFTLENYQSDRRIIFSLHDFINWRVYINGESVEKITNSLDLIAFEIPADYSGKVEVEIVWKTTVIEWGANIITGLAIIYIFLSLCVIFQRGKKRALTARRYFRNFPGESGESLDTKKPLVSIVIPVKNEEATIGDLLEQIDTHPDITVSYEVVVINHNSTDSTGEILENFTPTRGKLKVVSLLNSDLLLGEAMQAGINEATGQYIITMDGDLSHPVKFIPGIISKFQSGHDFIIGGRYMSEQAPFEPLQRYKISKMFNLLPRTLLHCGISDFTTGYRGFSKKLFDVLYIQSKDYNFHLEFNMKLSRFARQKCEVPIRYIKRQRGTSKLHYREQFGGYLRAIWFGYT